MDGRVALPKNVVLDEAYRVERIIGSGGFGITYAAEDLKLGTTVALKEYYPAEFGSRDGHLRVSARSENHKKTFQWGRTSFLQEARTLARFRHPSIVRVTRVFEALSTAYMVMDFEKGQPLEGWLRSIGRPPTQDELDRIAAPLLDALEMMHVENFLHRDIAPDNIIIRSDGTPVLLDFGAARRAVAEMSRTLTGIVKAGYSPHEQYATDSRLQGPWSDIYAFGATFYRAVTGKPPEEATLRVSDDQLKPAAVAAVGTYRPSFLRAIDECLKVRPGDRPQSISQLRPMLLDRDTRHIPGTERIGETRKLEGSLSSPARAKPIWIAAAAVLALLFGAYGGSEYVRRSAEERERQAAEARRQAGAEAAKKKTDQEARTKQAEAEAKRKAEETKRLADAEAAAKTKGDEEAPSRPRVLGLVVGPLNDELRRKHNIGKDLKGVIVLEVDPASPAAERGVKAGDVIVEVAQDAVTSLDDIVKSVDKVKKAGRKAVLLRLEDGKGGLRFVAVPTQ